MPRLADGVRVDDPVSDLVEDYRTDPPLLPSASVDLTRAEFVVADGTDVLRAVARVPGLVRPVEGDAYRATQEVTLYLGYTRREDWYAAEVGVSTADGDGHGYPGPTSPVPRRVQASPECQRALEQARGSIDLEAGTATMEVPLVCAPTGRDMWLRVDTLQPVDELPGSGGYLQIGGGDHSETVRVRR